MDTDMNWIEETTESHDSIIKTVMAIRNYNAQEAEQFLIDACNIEQLPF